MNKDLWLRRIRNICGLLGGLLPFLAIFSVLLIKDRPSHSLYSISATYYLSPALVAVLSSASIILMCYDGYTKVDSIVTTISGVFGLGIILFPCQVGWIDSYEAVGFFQVPMYLSNKIHCLCASVFFCLLAFNSYFLFTKTDDYDSMSANKRKRNIVYRVCGIGMLLFMILQVISVLSPLFKGYWTMINEIALLFFFSVSWLTKGNALLFREV